MDRLTLMLMALSSTSKITSPLDFSVSDGDPFAGIPTDFSADNCASGVLAEEASMKVIGVMRELGVRGSSFRGRSKYEPPSIVVGKGPRKRLLSVL